MRIEHAGERPPAFAQRAVQIPSEIESWISLKINFLDAVSLAFDLPKNSGAQRRLVRQRPQPATDQDVLPNFFGALLPLRLGFDLRERARRVGVFDLRGWCVGRLGRWHGV